MLDFSLNLCFVDWSGMYLGYGKWDAWYVSRVDTGTTKEGITG